MRRRPLVDPNNEIVRAFRSWREDDEAQEAVREEMEFEMGLREGTGAPEGRADFPLYMLSITRHRMRAGFRRRLAVYERYTGRVRAEDLREHTTSQLNGMTGMQPIPEFEEYPRLRSAEEAGPSYSVGKHGGVYAVTIEMIINDEANLILNRAPTEIGRMAAAYRSQVIVALIEANPNWMDGLPFFTSTPRQGLPNGNEYTGTAAEPSEDNLITIVGDLDETTDSEGFPIDISANLVLTKDRRTQLIFRRIVRSQRTGTVSNDTGSSVADKGDWNMAQGILPGEDPVVVEPYLRDPNDWILLADVDRPAFLHASLRDQWEPFIGMEDPGIRAVGGGGRDNYTLDGDEVRMKIRDFFGVALGDPRAARRARQA